MISNLLRPILLLGFTGLILAACTGDDQQSTLLEGCEGATWGSGIGVEDRNGQYVAVIQGDLPDACSEVCGYEQTNSGSTINIDHYSSNPEGMMCAQMLTPFD